MLPLQPIMWPSRRRKPPRPLRPQFLINHKEPPRQHIILQHRRAHRIQVHQPTGRHIKHRKSVRLGFHNRKFRIKHQNPPLQPTILRRRRAHRISQTSPETDHLRQFRLESISQRLKQGGRPIREARMWRLVRRNKITGLLGPHRRVNRMPEGISTDFLSLLMRSSHLR